MWQEIIVGSFMAYILTLLIVEGVIFDTIRRWLRPRTPFLVVGNKWLLDCRFCVCFWVSLIISFLMGITSMFLVVFGLSYFISTQERK